MIEAQTIPQNFVYAPRIVGTADEPAGFRHCDGHGDKRPRRSRFLSILPLAASLGVLAPFATEAADLAFNPSSYSFDEAGGSVNATVQLNNFISSYGGPCTVTADVTATSGTATGGGVDYDLGTTSVSITYPFTVFPATFTAPVTIRIIDDSLDEPNETFTLTLSNVQTTSGPSGSCEAINLTPTASATIVDNDLPPPAITITATDPNAAEPNDPGQFTVTCDNCFSDTTVNYTISGTATNGTDYATLSGSVTITPPGGRSARGARQFFSSATIPITPINDAVFEDPETVTLTLSSSPNYTVGSPNNATVTITSDDPPPPPTVNITSTTNAAEPSTNGQVVVTRTGDTSRLLTVLYTVSGTATPGTDFQNVSGSLAIAPGQASAIIPINVTNDTLVEGNETAIITLQTDPSYTLGTPSSTTVNIADDDQPLPTVNITSTTDAVEPSTNGAFTVTRTGATTAALTVAYSTSGDATPGSDYTALSGTVTIPAGAASATIPVAVIDDTTGEKSPEFVTVTLQANPSSYVLGASIADVRIFDNDAPTVTITATDPNASEVGPDPGQFTVTFSNPTTLPLTIPYTVSGTATAGTDYTALSGSVTIPANTTSAAINVNPLVDSLTEGNETVIVTLVQDDTSAYSLGSPDTATVTISDQPAPEEPVINITATDPSAAEQNREPGQFTITRSGDTNVAVNVAYTVAGTATPGADYAALGNSVTLAAGQTSTTLAVTPVDDALVEGSETVIVTLTSATFPDVKTGVRARPKQIIGPNNTATVTIADNDTPSETPTINITATDPNAAEQNRELGRFTVTRTGATTAPLNVAYALTGTATNGTDYDRLNGALLIPAGAASAVITVIPIDDAIVEGNEIVIATLQPQPQYGIGSPNSARLTIADNDTATTNNPPTLGNDNANVQAGGSVTIDNVLSNDTDPDGDPLTIVDARRVSPSGGTISFTATTITYTPPAGFSGLATLEYTVSDGTNRVTGTVLVNVTAPRDELTLQQPAKASEGADLTVSVNRTITQGKAKIGEAVSVNFATADGTAKAGSDYVAAAGTLNWAAGDTNPKSFTVRINADSEQEADETFSVVLSNPTGGASLGNPSTATVTIANVVRNFTGIPGLDPTQLAVARALDQLCATTRSAALIAQCRNLQGLSDGEISEALRQIAPEEVAALGPTTLETQHVQLSNIRDRLTALRRGSQGVSLTGLALGLQGEGFPIGRIGEGALKELSGGAAGAGDVLGGSGGRLGVFVNGRLDFGSHDRTGREAGFDFDTKGVTLGADYRISDKFVVGGALGYFTTGTDFDASGGNLDARGLTASVYSTFYTDKNLYIDAILGYGFNRYDTKRRIRYPNVDTTTSGDTDGNQWSASVTVGGDFSREAWLFSPYARLDYIRASIDGFNESGGAGLGLAIGDQDITSLSAVLGTRISRAFSFNWGVLTPTATFEWEHEFKDDSRSITSRFIEDPSVPFSIPTDDPDRNYFNIGVGAAAVFPNGRSGFISYEGVFGQDDFKSHTIQAGIRLEF